MNTEQHIIDIKTKGYTIIRNAVNKELIDNVVDDFNNWISHNDTFKSGNKNRVVNFHMYSENTLNLVTNTYVNDILEQLFGEKQCVYSSLTFKEGTAQDYHRDTPHFYTNPINKFFGIWFALEDININSGPLKYCIGSHNIEADEGFEICMKYESTNNNNNNNVNIKDKLDSLLKLYNKNIENLCIEHKLTFVDEHNYEYINKGDIVMWHPSLLHGGSQILDNSLTRYSMVTHNIPINIPVFKAPVFFSKEPTKQYIDNKCLFKYTMHNNVYIVNHGVSPFVQETYI